MRYRRIKRYFKPFSSTLPTKTLQIFTIMNFPAVVNDSIVYKQKTKHLILR